MWFLAYAGLGVHKPYMELLPTLGWWRMSPFGPFVPLYGRNTRLQKLNKTPLPLEVEYYLLAGDVLFGAVASWTGSRIPGLAFGYEVRNSRFGFVDPVGPIRAFSRPAAETVTLRYNHIGFLSNAAPEIYRMLHP